MKHSYTDLRVMKTKEAIQNAFFDLIDEKGFEAITITDVARRARVNRGTFYTYYDDKFDLFSQYRKEFMSKLSFLFKQNYTTMVQEAKQYQPIHDSAPSFITKVIELLEENSRFLNAVLNTQENKYFLLEIEDFVWEMLYDTNMIINEENLLVPKSYFITYVVNAFMGVIRKWLYHGGKESPEEIAQILTIINLKGAFYVSGSQADCK